MDELQTNQVAPKSSLGGSIGILIIIIILAIGSFLFFTSKEEKDMGNATPTTTEQAAESASLEQELDASVGTDIDKDLDALDKEFGN